MFVNNTYEKQWRPVPWLYYDVGEEAVSSWFSGWYINGNRFISQLGTMMKDAIKYIIILEYTK